MVGKPEGSRDPVAPHLSNTKTSSVMRSEELFVDSCRQLHIEHQGEIYTLRITSKGKLILTK